MNPEEAEQAFNEYAKVELFGHQVLIAHVTKAPVGDFVRCDVIGGDGKVAFTKLVNPKAIYALNLISRDLALTLAKARGAEPPVQRYELPAALPAPAVDGDGDEDDAPDYGDGRLT